MFISALRFETRTLRPRFLYKFFLITPPVCISLHTSSFVRPLQPLALRDFQRYYAFSFATVFSAVSFCRVRPFSHCVPLQNSICLHLCRCEQKNPKHMLRTFLSPPRFPALCKSAFSYITVISLKSSVFLSALSPGKPVAARMNSTAESPARTFPTLTS